MKSTTRSKNCVSYGTGRTSDREDLRLILSNCAHTSQPKSANGSGGKAGNAIQRAHFKTRGGTRCRQRYHRDSYPGAGRNIGALWPESGAIHEDIGRFLEVPVVTV